MVKKHGLSHREFKGLPRVPSRRIHGRFFTLSYYHPLPRHIGGPKIVCAVSKKVSPRAVERNTVKRRCRAATRTFIKKLDPQSAFVFHAKKEALHASYSDMEADIRVLLHRI